MTRISLWIAVVALLVGGAIGQQPAMAQAGKPCGDPARQKIAIDLVRRINTMQANQFPRSQKYQPMTGFPEVSVPPGFVAQLVTNTTGSEYILSVKDAQNPCGGAIFSDQSGLIYLGSPL